jgi:hypothetical protein
MKFEDFAKHFDTNNTMKFEQFMGLFTPKPDDFIKKWYPTMKQTEENIWSNNDFVAKYYKNTDEGLSEMLIRKTMNDSNFLYCEITEIGVFLISSYVDGIGARWADCDEVDELVNSLQNEYGIANDYINTNDFKWENGKLVCVNYKSFYNNNTYDLNIKPITTY